VPRLIEPLGIAAPQWDACPMGRTVGAWGLFLSTEEIARFGQLYLRRGNWSGRQLIPAAWIDEATRAQAPKTSDLPNDWTQGYGYQFWMCQHGTSPRGAAVADMVNILSRRFPGLHIRLFPALVQGEGSVEEVCRGIDYFSSTRWADLVIVGRGGGSLEDLWTFNEERVARAIAACSVPVISAVGHETDVTIADFVADLRAPTPSAAAELAAPTREDVLDRIGAARAKCAQALRYRLAMLERSLRQQGIERPAGALQRRIGRGMQRIDDQTYRLRERIRAALDARERVRRDLETRLRRFDVRPRLAGDRRRMEAAQASAARCIQVRLARRRAAWEQAAAALAQLSPLSILDRGYAIVTNSAGIVKDSASAPRGSGIHVRLAKGELDARVD
jgi:exodeoxyribonuclease VII large subunit